MIATRSPLLDLWCPPFDFMDGSLNSAKVGFFQAAPEAVTWKVPADVDLESALAVGPSGEYRRVESSL
jgi:hypothetical protein